MPQQYRISLVSVTLLMVIIIVNGNTASAPEPPQQPPQLPAWSFECRNSHCVKVQAIQDDGRSAAVAPPPPSSSYVSLAVCRLLCGRDPGTVWPKVRGSIDFNGGQQLAAIDPNDIQLKADDAVPQHESFWPQNRDRFEQQLRAKAPKTVTLHRGNGQPLRIRVLVQRPQDTRIWLQTDESYRIDGKEVIGSATVDAAGDGAVELLINATTIFGARHGLETLAQLIVFDDFRGRLLMPTEIHVTDAPAFQHRGLLLDTARNFYSIESLKRLIDGMALTKLNTFHWHITDSHSFPLVLHSQPELARLGAYAADKVYTAAQIGDLLDYAYVRGVQVVPEFDAPAHVGEGWQNYVNLTVCFNQQPWSQFCVEPPCGQLNPTRPELYDILGDIYAEMFELFRAPHMFHMGGDEVSVACWNSSAEIRDWMRQRAWQLTEANFMHMWGEFQAKALQRVDEAAKRQQITDTVPIVLWTSRLTDVPYVDDYLDPMRYIIQIWTTGNDPKIGDLLDRGYRLIMSNYDALYLDCGFGAWVTEGQNWCSPYIGWEKVYKNDWRNITSTPARRAQILGAEAALWSEQADDNVLDGRFWPRASALAERLWSDPETTWRSAEPRMLVHRERLVENGLRAESLQPQWCLQNEGECPI